MKGFGTFALIVRGWRCNKPDGELPPMKKNKVP